MPDDLTLDDLPTPTHEGRLPPDDLQVDGDNPNEMTDEQFGLLCDRMEGNGWLGGPIITDAEGLIADGEHRWRAAQEIGLTEVPVRQYEIDDATRRLWRQELNKIHGEHDRKRDALEYDHLLDAGFSEEVTELTEAANEDLDELLAELRMENGQRPQYEYDPEHNVYFEDCVEGMRTRLEENSVDLVFTSPPYNVNIGEASRREGDVEGYEDDFDDDEYREFLRNVFAEVARVVKPDGHVFVNHQHTFRDGQVTLNDWMAHEMPLPLKSYIIWAKGTGIKTSLAGLNGIGAFVPNHEFILHFSENPSALQDTPQYGVWNVESLRGNDAEEVGEHPAAFPVELPARAIRTTTRPGELVLDPFMGTGTTAVAAIEANRSYVGFELDEEGAYKPIIERRIGEAKRQREASVNQEDEEVEADD